MRNSDKITLVSHSGGNPDVARVGTSPASSAHGPVDLRGAMPMSLYDAIGVSTLISAISVFEISRSLLVAVWLGVHL